MYIKQNNWFLYAWLMVLVFIVRFFTVRSLLTVVVVFLLYAFVELWISLLVIFFVVLFSCRINDLIKTFLSNLLIFCYFFLSCSEIDFVFLQCVCRTMIVKSVLWLWSGSAGLCLIGWLVSLVKTTTHHDVLLF